MITTSKLTMDLNRFTTVPVIHAVQDDRYSRNIELTLLSDGTAWPIPESIAVRIRYSKPDGTGGDYDTLPDGSCAWSVNGNVLTLALAPQVLTVPGPVQLGVTLIQDQVKISTFAIILNVNPAVNAHIHDSEDYFPGRDPFSEPDSTDLPRVFFGSALPETKEDTIMTFRYISGTRDVSGYCKTKAQGSSSMSYPKKNQTTKLYKDAACTEELKIAFREWGPRNKFCFKANWIDHSHARNIIGARLWDEVVSCRPDYETLPAELRNSPKHGAIDGFPVKLYADGVYQGIYTLNIPKDAWMWNMDESNPNHVLLCAEVNSTDEAPDTACNFRAMWNPDNSWHWAVEAGEKTEAIRLSLNELIACIKVTDDVTFKQEIGHHLDVQSAIDYWIHQYVICGLDGLGKNLLMATYDGVRWICSAYDMDSTFGLYIDGSKFASTQYRCPEDYQESRSLLWERIRTVFAEEITARYTQLRSTVYSYANLYHHFEGFMDVIGSELYEEDLTIFPGIPSSSSNNIRQIRAYIKDRLYYTDIQFGLMEAPEPEKTIVATDYVQSASDNATTFELYNGAVDWNTQGLSVELSVEHTNQDGNIFFIGENLNSHDDDFLFKTWYWDNVQYMDIYIQSSNVNGDWNQCNVVRVSDYITDWSNIQIEVNKNGIFVNGNDIAGKAKAPDVYALLFERLMSKTTLQIGKKNADKLHPATFRNVYFYELGNSSKEE